MKAKDTVMNPIKLSEKIQHFPNWDLNRGNQFIEELCTYIAKAQDEISFSAGVAEGMKIVVEWIQSRHYSHYSPDGTEKYALISVDFPRAVWLAQLKEWGL